MSRTDAQFNLRLPEALRDHISDVAIGNSRSMNAEVLLALENAYGETREQSSMEKGNGVTVRLTAEMREKLDALAARGPYRISITSIIERGIELAALELEKLK